MQRDGHRRGYIIARGRSSADALDRAEAAARFVEVRIDADFQQLA